MLAQNYNPFVAQGVISPSPLYDVASNGTGQISFMVGNSGDDPLPLITNQEMMLVISLSRGVPNNLNPISALGGSFVGYFDWLYDGVTKSYLGTQNQTIPGALSGGVGYITIQYKVTLNSTALSPQNGFNVNVTPPPYTNGVNSLNDDQVSSYTWSVPKFIPLPDINDVIKNAPITGNLSTNDIVPTGSTYSNPPSNPLNPGACAPVVASNGTYTFSCSIPGEYNFLVPVCQPSPSTVCLSVPLTITVIDTAITTQAPMANPDIVTTFQDVAVTANIKANDKCLNGFGCFLNNPTIVTGPTASGATAVINTNGTITYTPGTNFVGKDSVKYQICDYQSPTPKCDDEWIYITVFAPGNPNSTNANDDLIKTYTGVTVNGSVNTNDSDPEGDTQTVTAQTTTVAGKGTLTLLNDGTYTFVPVSGFIGTVDFPYTICDNGSPQACANATIHAIVTFNASIALPANLASFTAMSNDCDVNLDWQTLQEENTAHFNVMRKGEQEQQYKLIATLNAAGNSSIVLNYSYTDKNVGKGNFEYKIEVVDIDTKSTMSNVQNVQVSCTPEAISVYPNPAVDYINIRINAMDESVYTIQISDMAGQVMTTTQSELNHETKVIQLPTKHLAAGLYHVTISNEDQTKTFKIRIAD